MGKVVLIATDTEAAAESFAADWQVQAAADAGELPSDAQALIVAGAAEDAHAAELISAALEQEMPILAMGSGMYALNRGLLGKTGKSAGAEDEKISVFIAPGSKFAALVGGSGWLKMPQESAPAIGFHELSDEAMPVCIGSNNATYAFELPGKNWVVGLYWDTLSERKLPAGFDKIVNRFLVNIN